MSIPFIGFCNFFLAMARQSHFYETASPRNYEKRAAMRSRPFFIVVKFIPPSLLLKFLLWTFPNDTIYP